MSELPEIVGVQEQAQAGGAQTGPIDPFDEFHKGCLRFIEQHGSTAENRAQAKTKLAEMIYWLWAK